MESIQVSVLVDEQDNIPFDEWYESLADKSLRRAIVSRILRVRQGNFGDHHGVGGGVSELRLHIGPGYRIYYGRQGLNIVVLLGGGSKRGQDQDIEKAVLLWRRYKDEIEKYSRDI